VNRLRFAWRVGRRSPALLVDYVRLWRASPTIPESTSFDAISVEEAIALVGSPPPEPGPAHALVLSSLAALGDDWASMDADTSLGELAYAIARVLKPDVVVETGVARGITSAFVLAALEDNGHGRLESIDLPPPRMVEDELVSTAIPHSLRARWKYHWGSSRRLLPKVFRGTARAQRRMFIHDSDHSYAHMRWELETAYAALSPGDVILCDDANFNNAFADAAPGGVLVTQAAGLSGLLVRS
jgi:hypothetical protein